MHPISLRSQQTGVNERSSEVEKDVCSKKYVDEQIQSEKAPVVETRNVSLRAVGSPIDDDERIRSVEFTV